MKLNKRLSTLGAMALIIVSMTGMAFADTSRVVTIGANLTPEQRTTMIKYFGVEENQVEILDVNNQEERKYLEGVAPEAQIGNKTFSCAYIEPTKAGTGINVKTANLNWVTSSMLASTLATAGVTDANVIAAAPFEVSGTGALTGVFKAFETATGEVLEEEKKEIATEEIIITGDLAEEIGPEKAAGIVNDVKAEIIKNNTQDTVQIAETINNVTNNYNINLSDAQVESLTGMMTKVAAQDYNYKDMEATFDKVSSDLKDKLETMGEDIKSSGIMESIGNWFSGIGDWFAGIFSGDSKEDSGILATTNDDLLGADAIIDATDQSVVDMTDEDQPNFFEKIWNWFTGLFNGNEEKNSIDNLEEGPQVETDETTEEPSNEFTDPKFEEGATPTDESGNPLDGSTTEETPEVEDAPVDEATIKDSPAPEQIDDSEDYGFTSAH